MPFRMIRDDITRVRADAIVNAANERLRMGGGVCGAIFRAAGARALETACKEVAPCATGSAVATPAFGLPARHVIHAVGPVWHGGTHGERTLLASCYRASLELAARLGCASVAFPLISAGIYGYPKREAVDVAVAEIRGFLATDAGADMDVTLVLFDADAVCAAGTRYAEVAAYVNDAYVDASGWRSRLDWENGTPCSVVLEDAAPPAAAARPAARKGKWHPGGVGARRPEELRAPAPSAAPAPPAEGAPLPQPGAPTLDELLSNLDATFSETLLAMIDERGLKDSAVYRRANLSRQHFSKIRSNPAYRPSKPTVLALAVALDLSLADARLLLGRAGFALSHADKRDVIVEWYLSRGEHDIYEINRTLYAFDQPLLG